MKKISLWLMGLSVVFAVLPILSMLIAGGVATAFNCELNEAAAHQCEVPLLGDIGGLLSFMGLFGWYVFFTVPIGFVGLILGVILLSISLVLQWRRARHTPHQS